MGRKFLTQQFSFVETSNSGTEEPSLKHSLVTSSTGSIPAPSPRTPNHDLDQAAAQPSPEYLELILPADCFR